MVLKLKSGGGCRLSCSAEPETGSTAVYPDRGGRSELRSPQGGGALSAERENVKAGTAYGIVEPDGECGNGEFRFLPE